MGDIYDDYVPLSAESLKKLTDHRRECIERELDRIEAEKNMPRYVVGLAHDGQRMAFVKKNRPEWQAGLLNGIGGHIEDFDKSPLDAMVREFEEETGVLVPNWRYLVKMTYPLQAEIWFFTTKVPASTLNSLYAATDEAIEVHSIEYPSLYPHLFIRNLRWIVPLALAEEEYVAVDVEGYTDWHEENPTGGADPSVGPIKKNSTL